MAFSSTFGQENAQLLAGRGRSLPVAGPQYLLVSGFGVGQFQKNGIYELIDDGGEYKQLTQESETSPFIVVYEPAMDCYVIRRFSGYPEVRFTGLQSLAQLDEPDQESRARMLCCCCWVTSSGKVSVYKGHAHDRGALTQESVAMRGKSSLESQRLCAVVMSPLVTCVAILAAIGYAYFNLPPHIREQPQGHRRYLDSGGIGLLCVLGVIILCFLFLAFLTLNTVSSEIHIIAEWLKSGHILEPIELRRDAGLSREQQVRDVFTPDALAYFKFTILIAMVAFNSYAIHDRFVNLPKRDPEERMNLARHIVGWLEEIVMILLLAFATLCIALLIVASFRYEQNSKKDVRPELVALGAPNDEASKKKLADSNRAAWINNLLCLRNLKNMSALISLGAINITDALSTAKNSYQWGSKFHVVVGGVAAGCSVLVRLALGSLGAMALCIKINSVDFVTEVVVNEYTFWNLVALAGFVNQVAGIRDIDGVREKTIIQAVCRNPADPAMQERRSTKLKNFIITTLLGYFSWPEVLVIFLTIDVVKLEDLILKIDKSA
eukprot:TRINITY_DN41702_c0_g1_i1.p1 TRINITY_DN41702_c0_g1~~TRINITY_DN41702_c0_g1_i1.p1  ORF type:complete len:550 (+),score=58.46 TRINITY_DN41702_c0_g1_i1:41-1690(+)